MPGNWPKYLPWVKLKKTKKKIIWNGLFLVGYVFFILFFTILSKIVKSSLLCVEDCEFGFCIFLFFNFEVLYNEKAPPLVFKLKDNFFINDSFQSVCVVATWLGAVHGIVVHLWIWCIILLFESVSYRHLHQIYNFLYYL